MKGVDETVSSEQVWQTICVSHCRGEDTATFKAKVAIKALADTDVTADTEVVV